MAPETPSRSGADRRRVTGGRERRFGHPPPSSLAKILRSLGSNQRLGLSGQPPQRLETEETARFYRHRGRPSGFTAAVLEDSISYLADDPLQLAGHRGR